MSLHAQSASLPGHSHLGMTLVELLVGLAITTLMTVAGWRAIESLQTARDLTQRDVAAWQSLDTFFETIEADMRRADLNRFSGSASGFELRLNPLQASAPFSTARYQLLPNENRLSLLREASDGRTEFGIARAAQFFYHVRDKQSGAPVRVSQTSEYPRAIEVVVSLQGNDSDNARDVRRMLVLR